MKETVNKKSENEIKENDETTKVDVKKSNQLMKLAICFIIGIGILLLILNGCKTIDMEKVGVKASYDTELIKDVSNLEKKEKAETKEQELNSKENEDEEKVGFTEEQRNLIPIIEPPETVVVGEVSSSTTITGGQALKQSYKDNKVPPRYRDGKLMGWLYRENKIYEVHTQIFRTTIIKLEPGEEMAEVPYISEPDVWRISRGIGYTDGIPTQLLMVKPDYSGLTSTLIIVTKKRIYQIELSSNWDHYMPVCQWVYENDITEAISWMTYQKEQEEKIIEEKKAQELAKKKAFTSYDYKISYGKKPVWCPIGVYDDGQKTYIILDEKCLAMNLPAVFNKNKEIINFNVDKNLIIIPQLIEKVTLQSGKEKVKIYKKK